MRTEIRNHIANKLELIDTIESPRARRKAYGGILVTLRDVVRDLELDYGEAAALAAIEDNENTNNNNKERI
jgi:hypothetical protein